MRGREGKILINDIKKRIKKIIKLMDKIEKYSKLSLQDYKGNFLSKLKELTNGLNVDEGRIELEAAIFAGKSDITEEIIRTKSHLIQFNDLLNSKESAGRKMDFIIQEINRETNTIGSKNNNLKITSLVILVKSELEKIREQAGTYGSIPWIEQQTKLSPEYKKKTGAYHAYGRTRNLKKEQEVLPYLTRRLGRLPKAEEINAAVYGGYPVEDIISGDYERARGYYE